MIIVYRLVTTLITFFNDVDRFHDPQICQLYYVGLKIFVHYSYIQAELKNMGGFVLPTLCVGILAHLRNILWNIVHPDIIAWNYY
jgi:hypothetical protein